MSAGVRRIVWRTPAGGSSKQLLVVTEKGRIRLRPLLAREAARLMGLPDSYRLPKSETNALKVMGDGVSVPVVRLAGHQPAGPAHWRKGREGCGLICGQTATPDLQAV